MPYYHVFIRYIDNNGKRKQGFQFGLTERVVKEVIAAPYMKNKRFFYMGEVVHPSNVHIINVYKSDEAQAKNTILPNGKNAMDEEDTPYILKCFREGRVKGLYVCTSDFITSPPEPKAIEAVIKQSSKREKVFIVHGRDETQALRLQKYLTKTLKLDAEMFEDFKKKSSSNTIIEQLEYIMNNVGYAFAIATPDDFGCLCKDIEKCRAKILEGKRNVNAKNVREILDKFQTRARQNVVFEHGLFTGALGRDRVCCLLQKGTTERPSDTDGILYVNFNKSVEEKFSEIREKLKKIGLVT